MTPVNFRDLADFATTEPSRESPRDLVEKGIFIPLFQKNNIADAASNSR